MSIRTRFAGYITTGDVLSKVIAMLEGQEPNFAKAMSLFLQKELRADQFVKLEQAGNTADQRTSLAQVFVDLPASERPLSEPPRSIEEQRLTSNLVAQILIAGNRMLNGSLLNLSQEINRGARTNESFFKGLGRFVIVGGPGQGKSTVGQFICQLYRAALLSDQPVHTLSFEARSALEFFKSQSNLAEIEFPLARRFPVRIVLDQFATYLANGTVKSLLAFIKERFLELTDTIISIENLRVWLSIYPWLIVLDGLDEVPPTSNRQQVLEKIAEFWSEVAILDADVLVIATTRPQGYNDDFSPRYYKHLFLTPLSQEQALHYASRLVEAQHAIDIDRKKRILSRLKMACEQETTQRLMRSPLQVTIMSILVDRIGQPPQERWRLFRQYYEVIYQRETERDILASRILQQRKSDVNVIHYRVGLLLQTESEYAGSTESKLPAERFYKLVHERIAEEGYEGEQLRSRTQEITDAALNRLVFLVGLEEDKIGFEIRSLQEFMAAEALMDGREEQVRARLETIAPIVHWRNVFLFAAGNCFSERQFYRDMIISICDQLNDAQSDKLAGLTLTGSRLAIDILEDGVAREQPNYARSLARIAVKVLNISDQSINIHLASTHDEHTDQVFKDGITQRLNLKNFSDKVGSWVVLINLMQKGIEWVFKLADEHWPDESEQQRRIMDLVSNSAFEKWSRNRFVSITPKLDPWRAFSINQHRRAFSLEDQTEIGYDIDDKYSWFNAIDLLSNNRYPYTNLGNQIVVPWHVASSISTLTVTGINNKYKDVISQLKDIPLMNDNWRPYMADARFTSNPSAATLSEVLMWLSNNWDPDNDLFSYHMQHISWPLRTCIMVSDSRDELIIFAQKAAQGRLGDLQSWLAAEQRWASEGVTENDLRYVDDSTWPYDQNIMSIGFPFVCSRIDAAKPPSLEFYMGVYSLYKTLSYIKTRTWIADIIAPSIINQGVLSPNEIMELASTCEISSFFSLDSIKYPNILDKDWIELFDYLGERLDTFFYQIRQPRNLSNIIQAYIENPDKKGILNWLGAIATSGIEVKIPGIDSLVKQLKNDNERRSAILIRISQAEWTDLEAKEIAKDLFDSCSSELWFLETISSIVDPRFSDPYKQKLFFLALYELLCNNKEVRIDTIIESLNRIMRSQRSDISNKNKWKELGLPVLP